MDIEIHGLDELEGSLNNMLKSAEGVNGEVSFDVLFNHDFMTRCTDFSSFNELLKNGGFIATSEEEFDAIPDEALDKHIAQTTKFENWEEMQQCAGTEYIKKKLEL